MPPASKTAANARKPPLADSPRRGIRTGAPFQSESEPGAGRVKEKIERFKEEMARLEALEAERRGRPDQQISLAYKALLTIIRLIASLQVTGENL
jgi:hypothetical protein